jgi:hypothetical protein
VQSSQTIAFSRYLDRINLHYTAGFIAFVGVLMVLEQTGLPRRWPFAVSREKGPPLQVGFVGVLPALAKNICESLGVVLAGIY